MVNEQAIIKAISQHLAKNQDHVARIISSNYSQNWLKTEAQIALNWSDDPALKDLYVHISTFNLDDEQGKLADIILMNHEKKIVGKIEFDLFDPHNPDKNENSIKEFKRRLDQQTQLRQSKNLNYPIIGILFSVWKINLPNEQALDLETKFYVDLTKLLKNYFDGPKFSSHTAFKPEPIFQNEIVNWGLEQWDSSLMISSINCKIKTITHRETALSWIEELADDEPISDKDEKIEINHELEQAKNVQQVMLKQAPDIYGFQFSTRYEACEEVSGDFYEFIELPDGKIGFAQGDVSGHGLQAGLVMSMAKKVLSINARKGSSPAQVLSSVNEELIHDLNGKTFVSMTYGILDTQRKSLSWARAGHNPSILFNQFTKELKSLKPPGMVVGLRDSFLFRNVIKEEEIQLTSGDVFLLYTDGLTETANRQGEPYRQERLEELIQNHGKLNVDDLLDRIMDSARGFRGGTQATDDITLLALKVD